MFETEKELDGVTDDNPNAPDEEAKEAKDMTDEELSEALKAVKDTPVQTEPAAEEKTTVEPAKEDPKPEPTVDFEAEVEKRLAAKRTELEAEFAKREQEKVQKAIDSVIAKERKREDSAVRKLRDLQAATGMDPDKLLESHRARQIEHLVTEQNLSEEAARELVISREKAALYESREAERQREHEEQTKTTAYRQQKLDFVADAKQPDIYKKALQKFGTEIDQFSDYGRGVDFDVALKYVAGLHLPEIQSELQADYEAKIASAKADAEAAKKKLEDAGANADLK